LEMDERSWARMPTTLVSENDLRPARMRIDRVSMNESGCSWLIMLLPAQIAIAARKSRARYPPVFLDLKESLV
jgi:hypothetical protein